MLPLERRKNIVEIIQERKSITVSELSRSYDVTEETIRRDLQRLEKEGFLSRTYGGAYIHEGVVNDVDINLRESIYLQGKEQIGRKCTELINNGDTLILDASTTALHIAQNLKNKRSITVITNSMKVCSVLSENTNIKVIQIGGTLNNTSLSFVGHFAQEGMKRYFADKAFISCRGISMQNGITDGNEFQAEVRKIMLKQGQYKYLIADSTKFGKTAFALIDDFSNIDAIVTDKPLPGNWGDFLNAKNIEIIYCGEGGSQ